MVPGPCCGIYYYSFFSIKATKSLKVKMLEVMRCKFDQDNANSHEHLHIAVLRGRNMKD